MSDKVTSAAPLGTRPRLVFVWNYLDWGGAQIYLIAIMKEAREEWDVSVALPHGSSQEILNFIEQAGVRYEFIDASLDSGPATSIGLKIRRQFQRIRDSELPIPSPV